MADNIREREYGKDEKPSLVHIERYDGSVVMCRRPTRPEDIVVKPTSIRFNPDIDEGIPMCQQAIDDLEILLGLPEGHKDVCWICLREWEMTCQNCHGYGMECGCGCPQCEELEKETGDPDAMCPGCIAHLCQLGEREAGWDATP